MDRLGRDNGCGRAMWEHEDQHDRYGTPMALMLLPFWTDGCIGSMEGLYFEASATTPYHFLMQDELSWSPSNAQRDMPYGPGSPTADDFDRGVAHLQMTGVKYYMAINPGMQALADAHTSLRQVATSGPWKVYEVKDAPLVQGLANRPAVLSGQPTTGHPWQDVSVCWWVNRSDWDVVLTDGGPADWPRVERTHQPTEGETPSQKCQPTDDWGWFDETGPPPTTAEQPVKVTNVDLTEDGISFDVDRPGVPVLVKVSYFPNWKVSGAQGPYRAAPNFMVVIPDGNHVELSYGWTGLDLVAWALTLVGIAGLVWLFRAAPVRIAPPRRFWGRVERPDLYPPAPRATEVADQQAALDWVTGPGDAAGDGPGDGPVVATLDPPDGAGPLPLSLDPPSLDPPPDDPPPGAGSGA
jgi:hypothetical protein